MQVLNNKDYKLFEKLVGATQKEMHFSLKEYLKKKYDTVISTKDYIVAVGEIPIALIAHMDTVFDKPVKNLYYDKEKNVMWSPEGLGADDRAGIFAIIKIIQSGLRPSVIFTTDEEIGGLGSFALGQKECPIKNLKYLIQLDRCNTNDCVFYFCNNKKFIKYIESFGFLESIGSFSDISNLMPEWKICGTNLSVGYKDEHSKEELLFITPLLATIEKVKAMLREKEIPTFEYQESAEKAWFNKYYKNLFVETDNQYKCIKCGKKFYDYEIFPVKSTNGKIVYYCPDCIVDNVDWCDICNEAYEVRNNRKERICDDCAEAILNGTFNF